METEQFYRCVECKKLYKQIINFNFSGSKILLNGEGEKVIQNLNEEKSKVCSLKCAISNLTKRSRSFWQGPHPRKDKKNGITTDGTNVE